MPLSDLSKEADRIEGRIMNVFIDDGGSYVSFGTVQDVEVTFSPVTQDADVANRQKQIAVDVELTFVMQQTTDTDFSGLKEVIQPSGNGHTVKATSEPATASNAGSTAGYEMQGCFPSVEGTFNGSGEGSNFTVTVSGRVLPGEISDPSTIQFN